MTFNNATTVAGVAGRRAPTRERRRAVVGGRVRPLQVAVTVVSVAYAALIVIWHGLRFTPVGEWWPFEMTDIFGLLLFAPLPMLFLVSLLGANRAAGLWLLLPVAVLAWEYGRLFLPHTTPTDGTPLRILSANLLVSNAERARIDALLTAEAPDIVALQELSPAMATHLAGALKGAYPHQELLPSDSAVGLGVGIFSRYPITVEPETGWYGHVCECQRVAIEIQGRRMAFINLHPPPPAVSYTRLRGLTIPTSFDRSLNAATLTAAFDGIDFHRDPLIVVGDFNVSDRQPAYRQLREGLLDAHREAGWGLGYSFPALTFKGFPEAAVVRIDYVLHNAALSARAAKTGTMPGSDHRYVVTDLLLR